MPTLCAMTLRIETAPQGSDLWLDGISVGQAPQTVSLSPGTHRLRAEREGWGSAEEIVVGECGERRITLTLRDETPPEISLNPVAPQVLPEEGLKIIAAARDASGVRTMTLLVDGRVIYETPGDSLRHNLDTRLLRPGVHQVVIYAVDGAGNAAEVEATFQLFAPPTATAAPTPTAIPSATPQPPPSLTPTAPPSLTPQPAEVVHVSFGEIALETYAYEQALYTDPNAGHPYPLLHRDQVGPPQTRLFRTVVMRNAYLELTFLPELGGRLYSMRFLPTGQEVLYQNSRLKPTHWGPPDQGWWLAVGGMEWCLPVDEHGYLTAQPWEPLITRHADGSATVAMRVLEQSRNLEAEVAVTLKPRDAAIYVRPSISNPDAQEKIFQFWLNAMVSPGRHGIGPELRFFIPATEVIVHSRGEDALPEAQHAMPWPIYRGQDFSRYGSWKNWLGFFAPQLEAPYMAVYDEGMRLGLVRVFPAEVAKGAKIFAFGAKFDNGVFSDDGAQYAEMWGGLTPTFWDWATLPSHGEIAWEEVWYPIAGVEGLTYANREAILAVQRNAGTVTVTVSAPRERTWILAIFQGEREIWRQEVTVRPDMPFCEAVPVEDQGGRITVRVLENEDLVAIWAE